MNNKLHEYFKIFFSVFVKYFWKHYWDTPLGAPACSPYQKWTFSDSSPSKSRAWNFFRGFGDTLLIKNLFKPIRVINRTHSRLIWTHGDFLGRGFQPLFAIWSISSHVGIQIGLELVRLIALIGLNIFWTNVTPPKSLKKFHVRHFDDPSWENGHFLVF